MYILKLILLLKNWPEVLLNFYKKSDKPGIYEFRNGLKIRYIQWINLEGIISSFIRNDYGVISSTMKQFNNEAMTVIDIGANIGEFSFYAALNPNITVYAYEPDKTAFEVLNENVKSNSSGMRIKIYNVAVASEKGTRVFHISKFSPLNSLYQQSGETVEVVCVGLKDVFELNKLEKCDMLKIDCEGAEYEILYNTSDEVLKKIKEIRMEYHIINEARSMKHEARNEREEPEKLISYLESKGFKLTFKRDDGKSGILRFQNST